VSFLGLPAIASDGRMLGHLAFFDTRPRGDEMFVDSIYRIFLARAAAEIERIQALARLTLERPRLVLSNEGYFATATAGGESFQPPPSAR
jgi:hypothetical protein